MWLCGVGQKGTGDARAKKKGGRIEGTGRVERRNRRGGETSVEEGRESPAFQRDLEKGRGTANGVNSVVKPIRHYEPVWGGSGGRGLAEGLADRKRGGRRKEAQTRGGSIYPELKASIVTKQRRAWGGGVTAK